jgi:hypothetical protein
MPKLLCPECKKPADLSSWSGLCRSCDQKEEVRQETFLNKHLSRPEEQPKYKLGDIVLYRESYNESSMIRLFQGKIISSYGLLESGNDKDIISWYYLTDRMNGDDEPLDEDEISCKL